MKYCRCRKQPVMTSLFMQQAAGCFMDVLTIVLSSQLHPASCSSVIEQLVHNGHQAHQECIVLAGQHLQGVGVLAVQID